MMKTLILHHVEPCWEDAYKRIGGLSFELVQQKILDHLTENNYDRIILTRFEDNTIRANDGYWPELHHQIDQVYEYSYGWEKFDFDNTNYSECEFVEGGNHSEYVLIEKWMKELPKSGVSIAGAFDGECIEDLEIALSHVGINFERIESLII